MRVVSFRADDDEWRAIEDARRARGESRTSWLRRWARIGLRHETARGSLTSAPAAPDATVAAMCPHPADKVLDGYCVACGSVIRS